MSTRGKVPVSKIWVLQRRLNAAVEAAKWDRCVKLVERICKQIKLAMDPKTSQTGKPHLDGVYSIGTLRYERAPKDVIRALHKMNRIIKTAKRTLE